MITNDELDLRRLAAAVILRAVMDLEPLGRQRTSAVTIARCRIDRDSARRFLLFSPHLHTWAALAGMDGHQIRATVRARAQWFHSSRCSRDIGLRLGRLRQADYFAQRRRQAGRRTVGGNPLAATPRRPQHSLPTCAAP